MGLEEAEEDAGPGMLGVEVELPARRVDISPAEASDTACTELEVVLVLVFVAMPGLGLGRQTS
jgi:hypothetical protein